ncbi:MAG: chloride channel protein [Actinomycetota bacterium]
MRGLRRTVLRIRRAARRINDAPYLTKWLVLGSLIGVVAGLGAILFIFCLESATKLLLVGIGGYHPPGPLGEGGAVGSAGFTRPWAIPLVVGLGGLLSGILTSRFAPEAEGHGTDAAIEAFHHNPRGVRPRVVLVKILSSAVTIGAGGSGGREGPTAQISAGFGSLLGRALDLSPEDARIAVAAGIGSGIGAIFRAPLGGAVLGAEILYRDDIEGEAILPSMIASVVGFSVFGAVEGFTPIFGYVRGYQFDHPLQLLYFALLGAVAGLIALLYARTFYASIALTRRLPGGGIVKPAVAGVLVGLLGLAVPGALGTGYGFVQKAITSPSALPLWIILVLPFVKILSTSLSIGSGGSGGIFGPGMVIGAFTGAAVWRLLHPFAPGLPGGPAPFIIVGMIATFGSISHAQIGVLLMVGEMTGSLALLAPAMIALGVAAFVVRDTTMYSGQLRDRTHSRAHQLKFGLPLLAGVPAGEVMKPPRLLLSADTPVRVALAELAACELSGAPVVSADLSFHGGVDAERLASMVTSGTDARIGDVADTAWPTFVGTGTLHDVVDVLVTTGTTWVAILDADRQVTGVVGMTEVIDGYRHALTAGLRRVSTAGTGSELVEETVTAHAPAAGRTVAEVRWPAGSVAVTIQRNGNLRFPDSETALEAGDVVHVLARPDTTSDVRALINGGVDAIGHVADHGPALI